MTKFTRDKEGRWYRKIELSGEDQPKLQRVTPEYEAHLEAEFGSEKPIVNYEQEQNVMGKDSFKSAVRDTLRDIITEDILQKNKDEVSLEMQKKGGGVVSLIQPKSDGRYGTMGLMIDALYDKSLNKNDKVAHKQLDKLWERAIGELRHRDNLNMEIFACVECGRGVERKQLWENDGECPYCGEEIKGV